MATLKIKTIKRERVTYRGKHIGWVVKLGSYVNGELRGSFWSVHPISKRESAAHFFGSTNKADAIDTLKVYSDA